MRELAQRTLAVALLLAGSLAACSTDSPTAPERTPAPPPGSSPPSATWNITITTDPGQVAAGSTDPVVVTVRVRRASDNQAPPDGATIAVATNLGDFLAVGSGTQSLIAELFAGQVDILFFPGATLGTAIIQAQLERSIGQVAIEILEGIVADFLAINPEGNLSVEFRDRSTGGPTSFFWDFGDGNTSTQRNPVHVYAVEGTYSVTLTASNSLDSDDATKSITVEADLAAPIAAFSFLKNPPTFQVLFFNESECEGSCSFTWLFGDGVTSTSESPSHTYGAAGTYKVTLRVENSAGSSQASKNVTVP